MNVEDRIQAAIVDYLRTCAPQCDVFHVPNGGYRTKSEAARLKWIGVLAGVPDLVLIAPGGRAHFIEVKAPKGVLKPEQDAFRDRCIIRSVPWMVARSIDDVRAGLAHWGIATREVASAAA